MSDHTPDIEDVRPALGTRGDPGSWVPVEPGASVALARPDFGDEKWSFLYNLDTTYAHAEPGTGEIAAANRRMRDAPAPELRGPFIKPPVWSWEVPLYFWVGGVASGSAFMALACDAAGDHRSAALARRVALGAVLPAPLLLIGDLGRPERFLNMLRIFKPRSPMSMGAWCLVAFSGTATLAVGADLADQPRAARGLGAATELLGGYLGSYTGVLLACTAVPVWARSRTVLGPIFLATATATGAAATRLTLVACGLPEGHPTRIGLGTLETASMVAELSLSHLSERRLGTVADPLQAGAPGLLFRAAKCLVVLGLSLRLARRRAGPRAHDVASVAYLAAGLAFRYAWVYAGKASARDDAAVAAMSRGRSAPGDSGGPPAERRALSKCREPLPLPDPGRPYAAAVRRASLGLERLLTAKRKRAQKGRS